MHRPAFVLACLLAGCAVSHARIDESPHAFVDAWFDAQCELALRCEYVVFRGSTPVDVCHPSARERWHRMADAVLADEARFDGARALDCVAALGGSECVVAADATLPRDVCSGVITGAAPLGSRCEAHGRLDVCATGLGCEIAEECPVCVRGGEAGEWCVGTTLACADGLQCVVIPTSPSGGELRCGRVLAAGERCEPTDLCRSEDPFRYDACVEGTCAPLAVGALGDECGHGIANCPEGSYCGIDRELFPGDDVPFACMSLRATGESCVAARCAPGLRCDLGICAPIGALGDHCESDEECGNDAPFCAFGRCGRDPEGTRCRPLESVAPIRDVCPEGLVCMLHGGVCLRPLELGAFCGRGLYDVCGENARCVDDVCTAIVRPGGSCASAEVCPPLHECNDGRCTPFPTIGEPCRDACHGGVCRDGRCSRAAAGEECDHDPDDCEGVCFVGVCAEPLRDGDLCDGETWLHCASPLECFRHEDGAFRCGAPSCG